MRDPYGRRMRQLSDIMEYDLVIQHINGTENTLADALSRFGFQENPAGRQSTPTSQCQSPRPNVSDTAQITSFKNVQLGADPSPNCWSEIDIKDLQGKDKDISQVLIDYRGLKKYRAAV